MSHMSSCATRTTMREAGMQELADLAAVDLAMPDGATLHEHETHADTGFRLATA